MNKILFLCILFLLLVSVQTKAIIISEEFEGDPDGGVLGKLDCAIYFQGDPTGGMIGFEGDPDSGFRG